jgi:hypothetical protein
MRAIRVFTFACLAAPAMLAVVPAKIDFQRDIRPILSDNCFRCHGPDPETRMVNLRLDTREAATAKRENGTAVVPGSPEQSLMWQRVSQDKPAKRMPPPYANKVLTADQKETIKRWIEQGATWKEHWVYTAPKRGVPPAVKDERWVRGPIDRFILAKLVAEGLTPAPEADRRTLVRRVALDLTGLPPKPAEVDAFLKDKSPDAYERMVDRYLALPAYGEHRARYWLDAARYADTHGIHIDNYREMWAYRDWVINAFNRNLSFDQFTIDQIAGDMLPNRTLDQQIASGFQRCSATTNEGGAIVAEVEANLAKDRVDTTSAVFLGLTLGCATCHDHKFDPIAQRDFYAMGAFFRNANQIAMDGNVHDSPPVIAVPAEKDLRKWKEIEERRAALRQSLHELETAKNTQFEAWLGTKSTDFAHHPIDAESELFSLDNSYQSLKPESLPTGVTIGDSLLPGVNAVHFGEKAGLELPNLKQFDADKPFTISVWYLMPKNERYSVLASQMDSKDHDRGWSLSVDGFAPSFRLNGDEGKSLRISPGTLDKSKAGDWIHLTVTYDGSREQAGLKMYWNGRQIVTEGERDRKPLVGAITTSVPLRIGKDGDSSFQGGAIGELRIFGRVVDEVEARMLAEWPRVVSSSQTPTGKLDAEAAHALRLYYLLHSDSNYRALSAQLRMADAERDAIARRSPVTFVMEERTDQTPFSYVLYRGMYDQPRDKVEPAVPGILPQLKPDMPRNRIGLAQWLVSAENPVTARVTVNRFWQEVFGTGIVRTAEDFGSQGELPSNQALLDWMAVEFRESGWDVKKFYRMLVTSATYRQSAVATPEKLKADPDNRLLSRGPRFRMDAEMVRDYALAASGLLNPQIGGPSVKTYQPPGLWEAVAMDESNTRYYKPDTGDKLYRRSLYWFWKRSAPPASLDIFNAPTREICTVRRERTNTPLQALVTMNDTQFVEAARHLAERALNAGGATAEQRFDFVGKELLARPFDEREVKVLSGSWHDFLSYYDANPEDAKKLLAVGESKADQKLNPAEFAAMTMIVNQVMNLDEVLVK